MTEPAYSTSIQYNPETVRPETWWTCRRTRRTLQGQMLGRNAMKTQQIDVTESSQRVSEFVRGLGRITQPIEILLEGKVGQES